MGDERVTAPGGESPYTSRAPSSGLSAVSFASEGVREGFVTNEGTAADDVRVLADAAAAIARSGDLDAALGRLISLAARASGARAGAFLLQDPDLASLQLAVSTGLEEAGRVALAEAFL